MTHFPPDPFYPSLPYVRILTAELKLKWNISGTTSCIVTKLEIKALSYDLL
jgi:hypothetical protein